MFGMQNNLIDLLGDLSSKVPEEYLLGSVGNRMLNFGTGALSGALVALDIDPTLPVLLQTGTFSYTTAHSYYEAKADNYDPKKAVLVQGMKSAWDQGWGFGISFGLVKSIRYML